MGRLRRELDTAKIAAAPKKDAKGAAKKDEKKGREESSDERRVRDVEKSEGARDPYIGRRPRARSEQSYCTNALRASIVLLGD